LTHWDIPIIKFDDPNKKFHINNANSYNNQNNSNKKPNNEMKKMDTIQDIHNAYKDFDTSEGGAGVNIITILLMFLDVIRLF